MLSRHNHNTIWIDLDADAATPALSSILSRKFCTLPRGLIPSRVVQPALQ